MIEKINESEIEETSRQSRTGKYGLSRKDISGALETKGQPFEVEWVRLPPGKTNFPCPAHQVQWEFYLVLRGQGTVRRNDHTFEVGVGDAFVQPPGTAHQIRNTSETEDLIYYVIADNPVSDPVYYPDSDNLIEKYSQKGRIVTNPLTGGQAELFDEHFTPIDILSDFRYAIVLLRKNKKNLVQAQDILKTFPLTLSVTKNELQIERDKILEVIGKIKSALEFRLAEGVINDE